MAMALRRSSPAPCIPEGITPDAPAARINGVFLLPMTADLRSAAMLDPRRYQCPHSIAKGDYRDALLPGRLCRGAPSGDDFARPAPALALDEGNRLEQDSTVGAPSDSSPRQDSFPPGEEPRDRKSTRLNSSH